MMIVIACCFKTRIWDACPDPDSLLHLVRSSEGGADHWEGWKQGRGEPIERCSVQATPQVGAWDAVRLGTLQGATENTEFSRRDRRVSVHTVSRPRHWSGVTSAKGTVHLRPRCGSCAAVAEWFPWTFYAPVAEKVPGLKGRGLFEEACYSPIVSPLVAAAVSRV